MLLLAAACSGPSKSASPPTSSSTTAATVAGGASTTVPVQTSGTRTVLSPIGINLRAQPSTTATILGSAAQGATFTVLGHAAGWYNVRGATMTGYITDDPSLSAAGEFTAYSAGGGSFSALYPVAWSATTVPPAGVVLRPPSGHDSIVVTTAATVSQLGQDQLGYQQDTSSVAVVCGVTGELVTYTQASGTTPPTTTVALPGGVVAEHFLVQIDLTLDAQHALGLDANLADLDQMPAVDDVINSLSFPFPQCQGGSAPQTATTATPSTVF